MPVVAAPPLAAHDAMAADVRRTLTARPPWLAAKYFYDDRGSELFEQITEQPEYYQTRAEEALLADIAGTVIARMRPAEIVELGSGAGRKVALLVDAARAAGRPLRLALLDINARFLDESARRLRQQFPGLAVRGVTGDFLRDLPLLGAGGGRLALFLAGTIGNLHPDDVPRFLARLARQLEPGDGALVGVDLVKDKRRLEAAYNDAAGVTAAFNRNILAHLNEALDGDFDVMSWEHVAFYDARHAWIEMRLRASRDCRVHIRDAGLVLDYRRGDEISTELSCKYTQTSFARLLPGTGLVLEHWFSDEGRLFALALLRRVRGPVKHV